MISNHLWSSRRWLSKNSCECRRCDGWCLTVLYFISYRGHQGRKNTFSSPPRQKKLRYLLRITKEDEETSFPSTDSSWVYGDFTYRITNKGLIDMSLELYGFIYYLLYVCVLLFGLQIHHFLMFMFLFSQFFQHDIFGLVSVCTGTYKRHGRHKDLAKLEENLTVPSSPNKW